MGQGATVSAATMNVKHSGEDHSGLKRLLANSRIYEFFQNELLGGKRARRWLANHFWKLKGKETVIDIGCGPGIVLEYLPRDIEYFGVDISETYIRMARRRFSARGTFFLGTAKDLVEHDPSRLNSADLVLCNGLLHHLSEPEALEVLNLSKRLLKPNGRLFCIEAVFLARQTRLSKWFVETDRGRHVRSEQEWKRLIGQVFESYSTSILTGLLRIPYTHIIIECSNLRSPDEVVGS